MIYVLRMIVQFPQFIYQWRKQRASHILCCQKCCHFIHICFALLLYAYGIGETFYLLLQNREWYSVKFFLLLYIWSTLHLSDYREEISFVCVVYWRRRDAAIIIYIGTAPSMVMHPPFLWSVGHYPPVRVYCLASTVYRDLIHVLVSFNNLRIEFFWLNF